VALERRRGNGETTARVVSIAPREEPLLLDEATGETITLDSFDLFAAASPRLAGQSVRRSDVDVSSAIAALAGLERLGVRLRPALATLEVHDSVVVDLVTRYAPYRDGEVAGEERSVLSEAMTRAHREPLDIRADLRLSGADGRVRHRRVARSSADDPDHVSDVRVENGQGGQHLVVGPLGDEPVTVQAEVTVHDQFGLHSRTRATIANFRVMDARAWVERTTALSLDHMRRRRDELELRDRRAPTKDSQTSAAMMGALVEALESLHTPEGAHATRVAGVVRLALRAAELLPAESALTAARALT
jgi:hypothetical protein